MHQRLEECYHGDGFREGRQAVADAQLHGAILRVRPDVPPEIFDRSDGSGCHETVVEQPELIPGAKGGSVTHGGQRLEDRDAGRGEPRVLSLPEGGAGRKREEVREVGEQAIDHRYRVLAVAHPRVDMEPEDHDSSGDPLIALHQHAIAPGRREGALGVTCEGMGSGSGESQGRRSGRTDFIDCRPKFFPHLSHRLADGGVDLQHGAEDLGFDAGLLAAQSPKDPGGGIGQVQTSGVENLQLHLDAEGQRRAGLERKGTHGDAPLRNSKRLSLAPPPSPEGWPSVVLRSCARCG